MHPRCIQTLFIYIPLLAGGWDWPVMVCTERTMTNVREEMRTRSSHTMMLAIVCEISGTQIVVTVSYILTRPVCRIRVG